ncbi:hypothetical protein ABEB36_010059 [Hypothenemus hampei]|uniref:Uncharacterized protein n=1 Tax=Hypothenemus hampei TaxID=57062 RepID=A0ABD1EIV2_HYPHA
MIFLLINNNNAITGAFMCLMVTVAYAANNIESNQEGRHLGKRRRPGIQQNSSPCHFGGGHIRPKNDPVMGRFFLDLQYLNVEHNYHLNINCGGGGGHQPIQAQAHPPVYGGHQKPLGHHHKPGKPAMGLLAGLFGGGNRPFQGAANLPPGGASHNPAGKHSILIKITDVLNKTVKGTTGPGTGVFSGAFAGILPTPQQFATGLSDGIQSFVGTLPAIGQSFQSILPSFSNFQLPQFNPGGPPNNINSIVNRPAPPTTPSLLPLSTTTDPDDIIFNDEIKPVHEDHDLITDPYTTNDKFLADNLPSGQYLLVSSPHLGLSHALDLTPINPTNLFNIWQQGIQGLLDEWF